MPTLEILTRRPLIAVVVSVSTGCGGPTSFVDVEIHDETPFHVFRPGEPFSFDITVTVDSGVTPEGLGYQWRDHRGDALGPVLPLTDGARVTVRSPDEAPAVGYYGLAFLPEDGSVLFNERTGSRPEIGFVVLTERASGDRALAPESPLGIVHADTDDPNLPPWIKTTTWRTTSARWWNYEMQNRRDIGLLELPIVSGDGWSTDDTRPVSADFLEEFENRIRGYFEADPATRHWELGREENLRSRFEEPHYFGNLRAKAAAARRAADSVGADVRFLYQIGGRSRSNMVTFLESEAADEFDIIAPHPYAWPDFPTPETWLADFIDERWRVLEESGHDFPMWLTEVGAPQNDARVRQMLSGSSRVRGQSRAEHASFLVKFHAIALERGVEKIFWYNYKDRDTDPTDVEDHFGLVDHWGFPKPAYAAYVTMTRCLAGKRYQEVRHLERNARVYRFSDDAESCLIAWVYPADDGTVSVSAAELGDGTVVGVTNVVGTPLPAGSHVILGAYPTFITSTNPAPSTDR